MRIRLERAADRLAGESGQILSLLALGLLVIMLGVAALVVDVGYGLYARRQLQASADAAALAAAQVLPDTAQAAALAREFGPAGKNVPRAVDDVRLTISTKCLRGVRLCSLANTVVVETTGRVTTRFARIFGVKSFPLHAKATACSPCGARPLDVMLVLDRTGSMCQDHAGRDDPNCTDLNNARTGMKTFLGLMDPTLDSVGLAVLPPAPSSAGRCRAPAGYDEPGAPYVVVPLSNDYSANGSLKESSDLVSTIECVQGGGSTSYATALEQAQAELDAHGRPGVQHVIVFLSDGAANSAPRSYGDSSPYRTQPCHQGVTSAGVIKGKGTVVYSIGYDVNEVDDGYERCRSAVTGKNEVPTITAYDALRRIASAPDDFYLKPDPGQLNTIFTSIAADIQSGSSRLIDDGA